MPPLSSKSDDGHIQQRGMLDVGRRVIATRHARVEPCRQQVGEDGKRRGGRVDPGEGADCCCPSDSAGSSGDLINTSSDWRLDRQRPVEQERDARHPALACGRGRSPTREVLGEQIDGAIAQPPEFFRGTDRSPFSAPDPPRSGARCNG
jgi:hypothetical protein